MVQWDVMSPYGTLLVCDVTPRFTGTWCHPMVQCYVMSPHSKMDRDVTTMWPAWTSLYQFRAGQSWYSYHHTPYTIHHTTYTRGGTITHSQAGIWIGVQWTLLLVFLTYHGWHGSGYSTKNPFFCSFRFCLIEDITKSQYWNILMFLNTTYLWSQRKTYHS